MTQPAPRPERPVEPPSFLSILLAEMGVRAGMAILAMLLAFLGAAVAQGIAGGAEGAKLPGALVGLAVGVLLYAVVVRRFNGRPTAGSPTT